MLLEAKEGLEYLPESRLQPEDNKLWLKAKQIARMDREYKANTAAIIAKRVYQMMGGTFKRKKR